MNDMRFRIEVMHGVNLDQLGRRDPAHYGSLTLRELEQRVTQDADEIGGFELRFFQTNHEGEFVERLHTLAGEADGVILNPGAWTHYSWAIRDALELAGLPSVEVHLSDVGAREAWRQVSVIRELCVACVAGMGADGYGEALRRLRVELESAHGHAAELPPSEVPRSGLPSSEVPPSDLPQSEVPR